MDEYTANTIATLNGFANETAKLLAESSQLIRELCEEVASLKQRVRDIEAHYLRDPTRED